MSKHEITEVTSLGLDVIYMYNVLFTTASLKLSFAVFIFWGQCNYRQDDPVQHIISRKTTTTTTSTTTTTTQQQQQRQQEKEQLRRQKQDNDDYISSINTTNDDDDNKNNTDDGDNNSTDLFWLCLGCREAQSVLVPVPYWRTRRKVSDSSPLSFDLPCLRSRRERAVLVTERLSRDDGDEDTSSIKICQLCYR